MDIKLNAPTMDRRSFLKASAAAAATLGASSALFGCDGRVAPVDGTQPAPEGAEWKTIACLHGCGTRCMNQVLVKDGVVIRQKTDDTHPDSVEYPQQRGCLRGRTMMEFAMGADRLKYPMKRLSWTPEDPHGDLRGKEGYERISWDEALDIVADQLKKAYTEHGPRSVYAPVNLSGGRAAYESLLKALGGYLTVSDTISYGTYLGNTDSLGIAWGGECKVNDRLDLIENADVVVMLSQNPGWGANGNPSYFFREARDRGAKFVCISPTYNVTASMLDAHWIPVKPGGDTALLIGVAYEMLRLDEEQGNIIDWDFLHKYCIGFDDESMPEGATTKENYKGYLQGKYDGVVKDAAWASERCGTPVEDIIWLAQTIGKQANVTMTHGYAAARCNGAEDLPQAYMALACMGGHFGKPGNGCGNLYVDRQGPGGVQIVSTGDDGMKKLDLPKVKPLYDASKVEGTIKNDYVNGLEAWDAIIKGKYQSTGRCWSSVFGKPQERTCDIRVIYGGRDSSTRSVPNHMKMEEALRKVDFVLMQHFNITPTTPYADIILPVASDVERDLTVANGDRDREMVLVYSKVRESPYEVKSDQWIAEQLLERLGYNPKDVYPYSETQLYFNKLANTAVLDPDENKTPLVTITEQDIKSWGVEGKPQQGLIGLEELRKKGIYQIERSYGDGYTHIAYKDYIDDPEGHPLDSESGKFELCCQAKADLLNEAAFAGEQYKPYPTIHEQPQDSDWPLLMLNSHYPRSACSDFDNVTTLRETFTAPITVSRADAQARGIKAGDAVLVSSPYGKMVRPVSVSPFIIPGAIDVPNGTWPSVGADGIDRGGCPNVLYGGSPRGMGVSGYNNVPVQVEKWTGEALVPDSETKLSLECNE